MLRNISFFDMVYAYLLHVIKQMKKNEKEIIHFQISIRVKFPT